MHCVACHMGTTMNSCGCCGLVLYCCRYIASQAAALGQLIATHREGDATGLRFYGAQGLDIEKGLYDLDGTFGTPSATVDPTGQASGAPGAAGGIAGLQCMPCACQHTSLLLFMLCCNNCAPRLPHTHRGQLMVSTRDYATGVQRMF